jgi:AcrR family transcriptional regulator
MFQERAGDGGGRREPARTPVPPPRTERGRRTRHRILQAAEHVFHRDGYHRASIVDITRGAGVGQGTFYLYFPSKEALFVELVRQMGHEMRRRLHEVTSQASTRAAAEREGIHAYLEFVAQHPAMYRIVRECEFVDHAEFKSWYEQLADGYVKGIRAAMQAGEFRELDPETVAYCLMGMGDFLGMRLVVWDGLRQVPPGAVDTAMEVALKGLLR